MSQTAPPLLHSPELDKQTSARALRMRGYCAQCDRELGLSFDQAPSISFYASAQTDAPALAACPGCSAALSSATVLSPHVREQREERRWLEELTGQPWTPADCSQVWSAVPRAEEGETRRQGERETEPRASRGGYHKTAAKPKPPEKVRKQDAPPPAAYSVRTVMQICETMRRDGLSASAAGVVAGVRPSLLSQWRQEHPEILPWLEQAAHEYLRTHTARPPRPAPTKPLEESWTGDLKWCAACNSYHVRPRDTAHWMRLKCFAPNPFRSARKEVAA